MRLNAWCGGGGPSGVREGGSGGGGDELGRFYLFSSHVVKNVKHIALLEAICVVC